MTYDPRTGNLHTGAAYTFTAAAPVIDNGSGRPSPQRYHDAAFAEAEWEQVFSKSWLLAAVASDLRQRGDFVRFDIGRESFIIVHGHDDVIRAHYNVCPHRGSQLVLSEFGALDKFSCPFHNWQFGLDGQNIAVTDRETFRPEVLCHDLNLTSVRCEVVAGLVFISMTDDIAPVAEWLAPVLPQLELYDFGAMNVVQHRRSDWAANWKCGVDATYESYHLATVHPQTTGVIDDRTQIDLYPAGLSRQFIPFGQPNSKHPDQSGINPGLAMMMADAGIDVEGFEGTARDSRQAIAEAKRVRARGFGLDYDRFSNAQLTDSTVYALFPNAMLGCHPEAVFVHRFLPLGTDPGQFTYDSMILYRHVDTPGYGAPGWMGLDPSADLSGATRPDVVHTRLGEPAGMGEVLDQDAGLIPVVHLGARSRGFRGPLWSGQEERLRHFHAELDRRMARNV